MFIRRSISIHASCLVECLNSLDPGVWLSLVFLHVSHRVMYRYTQQTQTRSPSSHYHVPWFQPAYGFTSSAVQTASPPLTTVINVVYLWEKIAERLMIGSFHSGGIGPSPAAKCQFGKPYFLIIWCLGSSWLYMRGVCTSPSVERGNVSPSSHRHHHTQPARLRSLPSACTVT